VLAVKAIKTPVTSVTGVFSCRLHPQSHQQEPVIPQITIDNQTYDLDTTFIEARAQLQSLQFVDAELARL
jgi:hypothetical protein